MEQYDANQGHIAEEITVLKSSPAKNLVIFGSPGAAKTLLKLGLIDEFLLTICPVVLGGGKVSFRWQRRENQAQAAF